MALSITDRCVNCYACEDVCPSQAISQTERSFVIDPKACTECAGHFADPQCASICPVEGALLDNLNQVIHPPGSLTGIPATLKLVTDSDLATCSSQP